MLNIAAHARRALTPRLATPPRRSCPGCPKHAFGLQRSRLPFSERSRGQEACAGAGCFAARVWRPAVDPGVDPNNGLIYLRARWYDPATGQFISVDPLASQTGASYYYADDNPVNSSDLSGDVSLGLCAGFTVHLVIGQLGAGDCLTEILNGSNKGQIGIVGTALGGLGLGLSAGLQWYMQVSNATNLHQLGSWFTYFAATAGFVGGVEGTFFWNNSTTNSVIVGGDVGVEAGVGLSGALGESYTFVDVIGNGWFGIPEAAAREVFSVLRSVVVPSGFKPQTIIEDAQRAKSASSSQTGPGRVRVAP